MPLPNWKSAAADLRIVDKPHIDTTQHKEDIHRFWPQGGRLSEVRREHRGTLGGGSRTVWKSSSQGLRPARRLHYFLQATMRATYWAQPGAGLAEPKEVRNKFRTCRMHSCRPDFLAFAQHQFLFSSSQTKRIVNPSRFSDRHQDSVAADGDEGSFLFGGSSDEPGSKSKKQ